MTRAFASADVPTDFRQRLGARAAEDGITGADWLCTLPRFADELLEEWELDWDGTVWSGRTAVALPVVRDDEPLVLKVVWPHVLWGGLGVVQLLLVQAADDDA